MTTVTTKYQGNDIVVLRDAHDGDVGFVPGSTDLVLIKLPDGTSKVVHRQDIDTVDGSPAMVLATTYEGAEVVVLRDAREGDPGFNLKHVNQVLIQLPDGTQKVVTRQDIVTSSPVQAGRFPSQAPGQAPPEASFWYKSQRVVILRDATAKDAGFVAGKANQVLVKQPDGSQLAVDRAEITQHA